jgi:hypothetical protein
MNQVVAFECGVLETVALLDKGEYVSPTVALHQTRFNIQEDEIESFKQGCIQAVNKYKFK